MLKRVVWKSWVALACVLFAGAVWCAGILGLSLCLEPMLKSAGLPFWLLTQFVEAELVLTGAFGALAGLWAWKVLV